jgi:hypothetical protein
MFSSPSVSGLSLTNLSQKNQPRADENISCGLAKRKRQIMRGKKKSGFSRASLTATCRVVKADEILRFQFPQRKAIATL